MSSRIMLAILNAMLWVAFLLLALTGLIMKFRINPEDGPGLEWHGVTRQNMGEVHFVLACCVVSFLLGHLWLNRSWISVWLKNKRHIVMLILWLGVLLPLAVFAQPVEISGSYAATANVSVLDSPLISLNHRFGLTVAPHDWSGTFDYRVELYTESSFHGVNGSIINERKFETQLNYITPLSQRFGILGGVLYHTNYTFQDTYYWAVLGLTYADKVADDLSISGALLAEKKISAGGVFYDASGTVDYRFHQDWSAFLSAHRYENFGELDTSPTQKLEYEAGLTHDLTDRFNIALSYFHHSQFDDPNDEFAFIKLKVGIVF